MTAVLNTVSMYAIPLVLLFIPLYAIIKGVKVYSVFTEGAKDAAEKAFGKKAENGMIYLPKVMSRKKQVAPFLLKVYGE